MADHTPGPWQAALDMPEVANNNPDPRLVWAGSMAVADCRIPWVSKDVAAANARLVAAAPDLLATCRDLIGWFDADSTTDVRAEAVRVMLEKVNAIRAAIAKAEGKSA